MAEQQDNNKESATEQTQQHTNQNPNNSNTNDNNQNKDIQVDIEGECPKEYQTPKLSSLQAKAKNLSRMNEKGIINEQTGSAIVVRENGQINLTSSTSSQFKMNPEGTIVDQSIESHTIAVRKKFKVNNVILNEHKLNPDLYEITDFKERSLIANERVTIGNFCINGSALVKSWEPNLKRYVLIRRPVRIPMFYNQLNTPEVNTGLNFTDAFINTENIMGISDKGYQVNALIKDDKSLIGKEGVDRGDPTKNTANKQNNANTDNKNNSDKDNNKTDTNNNNQNAEKQKKGVINKNGINSSSSK